MTVIWHSVLICGAGQLGSRYLQGLAKCHRPLRIFVQDNSRESLERAQIRWNEVSSTGPRHEVSYLTSLESLPRRIDLVIVATTADCRPQVVSEIAKHADVRFWILEKVLAQSLTGLDEIVSSLGCGSNAWVNTPRRMMPWHQEIKASLDLGRPLHLHVRGGAWGLACNAVHYLDLIAWWTGESLQTVTTARLRPQWFESKRPGNWEISGILEAGFSGGARAVLEAGEGTESAQLEVTDGRHTWLINEPAGMASRSDGFEVRGKLAYQSEMTAAMVETIIEGGGCALPGLRESVELHRVFIESMLDHWKRVVDPEAVALPIT